MADTKVTALTETTAPATTDLLLIISDPSGSPVSKRCTLANLKTALGTTATDAIWDAKGDLAVGSGLNTAVKLSVGTNGYILTADSSETSGLKWVTGGINDGYICLIDEKTAGTHGGTFTAGDWRKRDINTERADTGGFASISTNQITLAAGTYRCYISVPGYNIGVHKARLQNTTDASTTLVGSTEISYKSSGTAYGYTAARSIIAGRFTISGSKVFEIQDQCTETQDDVGYGFASGFSVVEVYTIAEFWKEK